VLSFARRYGNRCLTRAGKQVVEALTQGGPAEDCGKLKMGDVLLSIDGSPVASMTDRTPHPLPVFRGARHIVLLSSSCTHPWALTACSEFNWPPAADCQHPLHVAGELAKSLLGPPGSKVVLGMMRNKTGVRVCLCMCAVCVLFVLVRGFACWCLENER
jgi:hypothetical protein